MSWQITLSFLIVISISSFVLIKMTSDKLPKKAIGIFYQYLFCAIIVILYAFLCKKFVMNLLIINIGALGFANAFGAYCQWRAFELNLSKTALFSPLINVIALGLAVIFLSEGSLWNFKLIIGVILCFLAIWLFGLVPNNKDSKKKIIQNKQWAVFTVVMIVVSGVSIFLMKLSSFSISRETFLVGWYSGAFLGSIVLIRFEKQSLLKIPGKMFFRILLLSLSIVGSLFTLYWTFQLGGSISIVVPLQMLFVAIASVLIGLFLFKERRRFSKKEWYGFLVGIIGAILISLS